MAGELTVQQQKVFAFKQILNDESIRNRIRTSMGKDAGTFVASMLDLYESDNALQRCDPQKVAMECLKAASLKLPLVKSLGFAYVIPYGNVPTFICGYKGMIQLAQRSGQYRFINAGAVYKGEEVSTNRLTGQIRIDTSGEVDTSKIIGYFGYFQLLNGYEQCIYMTVEEVRAYAQKYSKAYNSGPWKTEFDAMARKTVLRRVLKFGPMSTDMQKAEIMEAKSAEAAAMAAARENGNRGEIVDVQERKPQRRRRQQEQPQIPQDVPPEIPPEMEDAYEDVPGAADDIPDYEPEPPEEPDDAGEPEF